MLYSAFSMLYVLSMLYSVFSMLYFSECCTVYSPHCTSSACCSVFSMLYFYCVLVNAVQCILHAALLVNALQCILHAVFIMTAVQCILHPQRTTWWFLIPTENKSYLLAGYIVFIYNQCLKLKLISVPKIAGVTLWDTWFLTEILFLSLEIHPAWIEVWEKKEEKEKRNQ